MKPKQRAAELALHADHRREGSPIFVALLARLASLSTGSYDVVVLNVQLLIIMKRVTTVSP
jgi:hypothetical protein